MVKLPWFSMYAHAWLTSASVVRMNCTQEGAYIRLLCYAWIDKTCSLPRETRDLMKMARWRGSEEGFEAVENCFIIHPEDTDRYTNARLYEEWKKANTISASHRKAALKRWEQKPAGTGTVKKPQDRTSKGFSSIGSEVGQIADKHFPPQ